LIESGKIGKPIMLTWTQHNAAREGKYFHTGWRTDMSYSSGFLLDGGVHHIAAIRTLMGEVAALSAFTAQVYPDMPPAETLMSSLRFDNGAVGSYNVTYANGSPYDNGITVLGDKGSFKVRLDVLDTSGIPEIADGAPMKFTDDGIYLELADFANAIQNGKTPISTPEQAVQDVAIIEAMFRAAESGKVVTPERIV
jgi:predicted dehydrogenase